MNSLTDNLYVRWESLLSGLGYNPKNEEDKQFIDMEFRLVTHEGKKSERYTQWHLTHSFRTLDTVLQRKEVLEEYRLVVPCMHVGLWYTHYATNPFDKDEYIESAARAMQLVLNTKMAPCFHEVYDLVMATFPGKRHHHVMSQSEHLMHDVHLAHLSVSSKEFQTLWNQTLSLNGNENYARWLAYLAKLYRRGIYQTECFQDLFKEKPVRNVVNLLIRNDIQIHVAS